MSHLMTQSFHAVLNLTINATKCGYGSLCRSLGMGPCIFLNNDSFFQIKKIKKSTEAFSISWAEKMRLSSLHEFISPNGERMDWNIHLNRELSVCLLVESSKSNGARPETYASPFTNSRVFFFFTKILQEKMIITKILYYKIICLKYYICIIL